MPFGLGMWELVIIFLVALIVFGPRKLPELGKSLGKGLSEFKRASNELKNTLDDEIRLEDHRAASATVPPPPAPAAAPEFEPEPEPGVDETVARGEARS
jgi:sec-independent protein translocase protein TatA